MYLAVQSYECCELLDAVYIRVFVTIGLAECDAKDISPLPRVLRQLYPLMCYPPSYKPMIYTIPAALLVHAARSMTY